MDTSHWVIVVLWPTSGVAMDSYARDPKCLSVMDILGMERSRNVKVGTINHESTGLLWWSTKIFASPIISWQWMALDVEILPCQSKDQFIAHSWCRNSWCPGDARSQDTTSHGTRVGVTRPIYPVPLIFRLFSIIWTPLIYWIFNRWHLLNMNVIQKQLKSNFASSNMFPKRQN